MHFYSIAFVVEMVVDIVVGKGIGFEVGSYFELDGSVEVGEFFAETD